MTALLADVRAELAAAEAAYEDTHQGLVHADNKQEGDKDTRAIETTYLARGLAERVETLREAMLKLEALRLRAFPHEGPAALTALVRTLDEDQVEVTYFLVPAGAGKKLDVDGEVIRVITSQSPVGRALIGKHVGDVFDIRTPKGAKEVELTAIE